MFYSPRSWVFILWDNDKMRPNWRSWIHAFNVNALFTRCLFFECTFMLNNDDNHSNHINSFMFLLFALSVAGGGSGQESPVTQTCLGCICEAISGCNRTSTCAGDVCGLFRITWAYWSDAGKPTVAGEPPSSETGTYTLNHLHKLFASVLHARSFWLPISLWHKNEIVKPKEKHWHSPIRYVQNMCAMKS